MWSTYVIVTVGRDIRIGLIEDLFRGTVHEVVPNRLTLAIGIPATLDLVRRRSDAPSKVRWESAYIGRVLSGSTRTGAFEGCDLD